MTETKNGRDTAQLFLNRTLDALKLKCRKLKLPVAEGFFYGASRWTPAQDAELLRLKQAGASYTTIGAIMGKKDLACKARYLRLKDAPVQQQHIKGIYPSLFLSFFFRCGRSSTF
jgi:hypothetical protein